MYYIHTAIFNKYIYQYIYFQLYVWSGLRLMTSLALDHLNDLQGAADVMEVSMRSWKKLEQKGEEKGEGDEKEKEVKEETK